MSEMLQGFLYRLRGEATDLPAILVELLLIGLCVNWVVSILHGTRGTRPLRGVLVILVVTTLVVRILTVQFEWVRLSLLYSYVLYSLAFIALVVFQPELRRAIIRIGDVRFRRTRVPQSQVIAALVKSAGYLSRNRYGALIAIQRSVDLTGWAENGTLLQAEVSANLLNTVFFPGTPLHDLGVIIRGTRVLSANCQFPAAESDEVDIALGSRHLAAVGMSYETDALVLVVSEETGVVSLADNGKLTRYLSLDDLADELANRLAGRTIEDGVGTATGVAKWSRGLRRLAVVIPLTLIIWYVVDQATMMRDRFPIVLEIRNDDPSRDAELSSNNTFDVDFSGPGRAIDRARAAARLRPLHVVWSPKGYAPQNEPYAIDAPDEIRRVIQESLPEAVRGLNVEKVALTTLAFNIYERAALKMPVTVAAEARTVRIASEVSPNEVEVRVRRIDLDKLKAQKAIVAPVGPQLEGLLPGEKGEFTVQLKEPTGLSGAVQITPRTVQVSVRIVSQKRKVRDVVVKLFVSPEIAERYEVRKHDLNEWKLDLDIQGDEAVLDSPTALDIQAFVHVPAELITNTPQSPEEQFRTLDVIFLAPKGVSVIERRSVRVTLVPRGGAGGP